MAGFVASQRRHYINLFLLVLTIIGSFATCDYAIADSNDRIDFPKTQPAGVDQEINYTLHNRISQDVSITSVQLRADAHGGLGCTVGSENATVRESLQDGGRKRSSERICKDPMTDDRQTTILAQLILGNPIQSCSNEIEPSTIQRSSRGLTENGATSTTSDVQPSAQAWGASLGFIIAATVILLGADQPSDC